MLLRVLVLTVAILVLLCVMWVRECRFGDFGQRNEQTHKKRESLLKLRNLLLSKGILREGL